MPSAAVEQRMPAASIPYRTFQRVRELSTAQQSTATAVQSSLCVSTAAGQHVCRAVPNQRLIASVVAAYGVLRKAVLLDSSRA
jgi:hypothetical protein